MFQSSGSREVLVKLPPRISEIAGLNAEAPPAVRAGIRARARARRRIGGRRVDGLELLDARLERFDARAVFALQSLQFRAQRRDVIGAGRHGGQRDQRQQRRHGPETLHGLSPLKPTNTPANHAGVQVNAFSEDLRRCAGTECGKTRVAGGAASAFMPVDARP